MLLRTKRLIADVEITFLTRIEVYISSYNVSIQYSSQQHGKQHILWWLSGHRHSINFHELIACQKTFIYHGLQMNRGNYLFSEKHFKSTGNTDFLGPSLGGAESGFKK